MDRQQDAGRLSPAHQQAALAFALDLAKESDHLPRRALSLLDRHFGFRRSIFFPGREDGLGHYFFGEGQSQKNALYITYGISYSPMYNYKDTIYQKDPFRCRNLPAALRGKSVVYSQDIQRLDAFGETPYGVHMRGAGLPYQACLYLYAGKRVLSTLTLFHGEEEGPFSEAERPLLRYLAALLQTSYLEMLRHSGQARLLDSFRLFFPQMSAGAILLNQDLTVMQANEMACELGRQFWETYRHEGRFLQSNYQGDQQYRAVQTMVNELEGRFTRNQKEPQVLSGAFGDLCFYHNAFFPPTVGGTVPTWHILILTYRAKVLPQERGQVYDSLTPQEQRIAYFLSSGTPNERIAEELHISIFTVRTHIANIYKKFEVNSKVDLLLRLRDIFREN